jgi:hypothetical protein
MLHDVAPHLWYEGHGDLLRSLTNDDGKTTFAKLGAHLTGADKQTHGYRLDKISKPFMSLTPLDKQEIILNLGAKDNMLLVDYHRKRHSKVTGHVVGVSNGKVYDNDEETGGVFDLKAYAEREWEGVHMARIVVPK